MSGFGRRAPGSGPPFRMEGAARGQVRRPRRAARGRRQRRHGAPPCTARSSSRSAARTAATAATAATSCSSSTPACTRCWTSTSTRTAMAGNGKQGLGSLQAGANGEALELRVPDGTVVLTADGEVLADLTGAGTRFVAARGGRGGLGNARARLRRAQGPRVRAARRAGRDPRPRPGAEESSPTSAWSDSPARASPRWSRRCPRPGRRSPTTRSPRCSRNLGVVTRATTTYTVADVPGLIPGAAEGKGLGLEFLRHIERCAVLLHVIDCATLEPGRDPVADIEALEHELAQYDTRARRSTGPRLVALNKIDVPDARELAELVRRGPRHAARLAGVRDLARPPTRACPSCTFALAAEVERRRASRRRPSRRGSCCARPAVDDAGSRSSPTRRAGRVRRPRRAARSAGSGRPTSTTTRPSATSADRLARLGVEDAAGCKPAPCPAPRSPSATSRSTGSRAPRAGVAVDAAGARHRPAAGVGRADQGGRAQGGPRGPARRAAATPSSRWTSSGSRR